ncbi:unnamed protein product [Symbiodinium microadriaticum]|nr:unnamed protein product [Symbiodinium microadriaticum]CAE7946258.1 unnamed protein product [Symbiodinium sp. KB8]
MSDWQGKQARWGQSPGRNQEHGEPLHEGYNPQPEGPSRGRRWRRKGAKPPSPEPPPAEPGARVVWLLGNRCVELLLPSGEVRCSVLAADIKAGSRSVATSVPGRFYVLENGSSRIWQVELGKGAWPLCDETEARRFRASLGSRFVSCGPDGQWLLVTGTPHHGAHSPWLFDLETQRWRALPAAPHAILSSAVAVQPDGLEVTILGGWSKMSSCHGHVQRLSLLGSGAKGKRSGGFWAVLDGQLPWRRPGAGAFLEDGRLLVSLGWMECEGAVGTQSFRLLPRNGAAQRARSSSSRLVALSGGARPVVEELAVLPLADSFENLGQIFDLGGSLACVGRDHVQAFDMTAGTWQRWPLPAELAVDGSSSWAKHCGSWAVALEAAATAPAKSGPATGTDRPPPVVAVQAPRLTDEEQKLVDELFRNWEGRISQHAKSVKAASTAALEMEREYTDLHEKVQVLKEEREDLMRKQEGAQGSMQLIREQQDLLAKLLEQLETQLDLGSTLKTPRSTIRLEDRAAALESQLGDLTQQVRELADATVAFEAEGGGDPLDQVAHLLAAHSSELDAVQERLDATEKKLKIVEGYV